MIGMAALSVLSIGAIGFYVRFLLALWKESRRHWISFLVRLDPESEEVVIYEEPAARDSMRRAA
jgi:hypothetical protein